MSSAVDRAYEEVRTAIVAGKFAAGDRLVEEDLAAAIGVSRTPVREALRRLAGDGLVEYVPNRGAHVAAWSEQDLREIFGLRALLEGHAARMAASAAEPDDVEALRGLVAAMKSATADGDLDELARLNDEFHHRVMSLAGNARLTAMVEGLVQMPLVQRTFRRYSKADLRRSMTHHGELVDALEQGDPAWAEAIMRSHILAARNVVLAARG